MQLKVVYLLLNLGLNNIKMKKYLFITFILLSLCGFSQKKPLWLEASWRESHYPANSFLTGFSQDIRKKREPIAEASERVKNIATGYVAKNLISNIQTVSENYSKSIAHGNNEKLQSTFEMQTKAETDAIITGIKVESYYDKKSKQVYAFAYVNKKEVSGYYKTQISMLIQQIEGHIFTADQLKQQTEKIKAEAEYNKTTPLFTKIEYAQILLSALDKNIDEESSQIQKSINLRNKVTQALAALAQGPSLFINCDAQLFNISTNMLENKLKAELAKNNCIFVSDSLQADWLISIEAQAEKYNDIYNTYYSYVNATITLQKRYNNQVVYKNELKEKGGSARDYKDAAEKAYIEIANKISEELIKYIE